MLRRIYNLYVTIWNAHVERHNRTAGWDPDGADAWNAEVDMHNQGTR